MLFDQWTVFFILAGSGGAGYSLDLGLILIG